MKVLFKATSTQIFIEMATTGHDDEAHDNGKTLTPETKAKIKKMCEEQKTAATIRNELIVSSLLFRIVRSPIVRCCLQEQVGAEATPSLKQIENQLSYIRKKQKKTEPLTNVDLVNYATPRSNMPTDENQPFVVSFVPYEEESKHFLIVWSTPKLVRVQQEAKILYADATYKLNWFVWILIFDFNTV